VVALFATRSHGGFDQQAIPAAKKPNRYQGAGSPPTREFRYYGPTHSSLATPTLALSM
jgi:hypothetical protein